MKKNSAAIIIVMASAFLFLATTACGPAALEAKRMADQCNATYGFNTAKSVACMDTDYDRLAMVSGAKSNEF